MSKLVLFDIDGTLVLTGGAGVRAMNRACEELIGSADALQGIAVAGRTDWSILGDALERLGRRLDDDLFGRLRDRYAELLGEEILHQGSGFHGALPGVTALLDELQSRPDVHLGLLTGNFRRTARIKLERFDLWRYFPCGAFGDDAADRNELVPFAVTRARACGVPDLPARHVIVVGDTPNDIACAQAAGAVPVGVATGHYSADQLRACGAETVFETLEDARGFAALL